VLGTVGKTGSFGMAVSTVGNEMLRIVLQIFSISTLPFGGI
jgi:hypothetical protein